MNSKRLINQKNYILNNLCREKNNFDKNVKQAKRMKKTVNTIFVTDDLKENTSLIKKREAYNNKKRKGVFIKVIKKNQIIMFVSALSLICVGYLAYNPMAETNFVSTTLDNSTLADIGDATFVSSSKIVEEIEKSNNNTAGGTLNESENSVVIDNSIENKAVDNKEEVNSINTSAMVKAENDQKEQSDYFINSKLDRDKMYSQMLESYQKILDNSSVSAEQKAIASQEISKINNQKNSIMIAENLIKTKGLEEVVIFINLDSISVIVKADKLTKEQIAQIQNIVTREMNTEISNVHISTR